MALKRKCDVYTKSGKLLTGDDLQVYKTAHAHYTAVSDAASDDLGLFIRTFCKQNNLIIVSGLTPVECTKTEEYKNKSKVFAQSFAALRNYNSLFKLKAVGWE
jgi:hypothetical protein